jgi:hypothetical protein
MRQLGRPATQRVLRACAVVIAYSIVSLYCWHPLLSAGIVDNVHVAEFGDPGQGVWFMGWLPFALGHGINPFHSAYMYAPRGFNVLANTSFLLEALLLSPITVLANPVLSFNIACISGPVISGAAMYYAVRKLDMGGSAAFISGAMFAFAPAIFQEDPLGHFNLTWMFFPPLLVLLLERILIRQQGSPWRYGLGLGALVVVQFFSSLEILLDSVLLGAVALVILCVACWRQVPTKLGYAARAFASAAVLAGVLLAYPVYAYFAGPEHLSLLASSGPSGATLISPLWPSQAVGHGLLDAAPRAPLLHRFDSAWCGPVLVLLALGAFAFSKRTRTVFLLWAIAVVSYVLSWGTSLRLLPQSAPISWHAPAWYLGQAVPLFKNVGWIRFASFTDLCLAILAAITLEEFVARAVRAGADAIVRLAGVAVVSAIAIASVIVATALPFYGFTSVSPPAVLRDIPQHNGQPPIAVVYPSGGVFDGPPLATQAVAGFTWRDWSGYAWHPVRPGSTTGTVIAPGNVVQYLVALAPVLQHERLTPSHRRQIRDAVEALGARYVVILDGYNGSARLSYLMAQVFGHGQSQSGGRIWTVPNRLS